MPKEQYGAAEALERGGGNATGETFTLPSDTPGCENAEVGDTITLRVVGRDKNGGIEVEYSGGAGQESSEPEWKSDLRQSMAPEEGEM